MADAGDIVDQLGKLAALRDSGALSPDEFELGKTALLGRLASISNESERASADDDDEGDDDEYDLEHSIAELRFRGAKTLSGILLAVAWIVLVLGLIGSIVIGADAATVGASPSNGVAIGISTGLSVVIFSALLAAAGHVLRLLVAIWDELWRAGYWEAGSDDEAEV
jgi:hypothetical protein